MLTDPAPMSVKVPEPRASGVVRMALPPPETVSEEAVMVPPPKFTLPAVLLINTSCVVTPALVTVMG